MNIKDHIEAEHYPKDHKGRALVPTEEGAIAVICATDKPGSRPIIGWIPLQAAAGSAELTWNEIGRNRDCPGSNLLPPPPRKVKVRGVYALITKDGGYLFDIGYLAPDHSRSIGCNLWTDALRHVELTGEYEEPWS